MTNRPFDDPAVASAFGAFPAARRVRLMAMREMIFDVAEAHDCVGRVEETLKWGQPAYLTPETRSGSTLRLGMPKEGGVALYAHCQTTIISDFRAVFPDDFTYEGNRAVTFDDGEDLQPEMLKLLIKSALTYHLRK